MSAVALVVGTVALVLALPRWEAPPPHAPDRSRMGALAVPGIQTLVASMLPVGFAFGALEVALPAFAHDEGRPELSGVLVALWAFGSVTGGLIYGARTRRGTLAGLHLRDRPAAAALVPAARARGLARRHGGARAARGHADRAADRDAATSSPGPSRPRTPGPRPTRGR